MEVKKLIKIIKFWSKPENKVETKLQKNSRKKLTYCNLRMPHSIDRFSIPLYVYDTVGAA
jgi:hypothetical protein